MGFSNFSEFRGLGSAELVTENLPVAPQAHSILSLGTLSFVRPGNTGVFSGSSNEL
jgi:hypothetical protein